MRFTLYPIHWLADQNDREPFDQTALPFEITEDVHIEAVADKFRPGTFDLHRRHLGDDLVEVLERVRYAVVHRYNPEMVVVDGEIIGEVQHNQASEKLVREIVACLRLVRPMRQHALMMGGPIRDEDGSFDVMKFDVPNHWLHEVPEVQKLWHLRNRDCEEPYRTLVLFLALVPKRIEEAIALRPSDLDEHNVLHLRRAMYERKLVEFEPHEYERIPLDSPAHAELVKRLHQLGDGHVWIFRSRKGTPVDPHNGLFRKLHPACKSIGLKLGGWHDFRHTFNTAMRRAGVHSKVRSAALGHNKSTGLLVDDVYDHASQAEIRRALVLGANWLWKEEEIQEALMSNQLCPQMCPEAHLQPTQFASA